VAFANLRDDIRKLQKAASRALETKRLAEDGIRLDGDTAHETLAALEKKERGWM